MRGCRDRHHTDAVAALDRIQIAMSEYMQHGITGVACAQVLDLANPQGNWKNGFQVPPPQMDPAADPLTGCLPVTARPAGQ